MIGGLCFGANTEYGQFPTMYRNLDGLPVVLLEIPDEEIVDVDATGAAFTLTHRSVFENNQRDSPHKWFHRREVAGNKDHPGGFLGEDISWCWWLREREVRIIVDTTIEAGHVKPTIMSLENYPRNSK